MRKWLLVLVALGLSACVTVPKKDTFSKAQVETMTGLGFEPAGATFELDFSDRVLFEVDKSELTPEANAALGRLAIALVKVEIRGASVVGHTDSTGTTEYNIGLSQRRAASVKGGLAAAGMDAARIRDQGVGEAQPVGSNETEEGRAQNRRVVIIVSPDDAD